MAFAFEEAHKRFTPEVFICAFSSVVFGILTRTVIYQMLGMSVTSAFHSYKLLEMPLSYYGYVVAAGVVCGFFGVGFYKLCFWMRDKFKYIHIKDEWWSHVARITIAVLLGGLFSFLAVGVMGGGHDLIESLGTKGGTEQQAAESVFSIPLVWVLLIVLVLKTMITAINVGSRIPCGIFIPIIAIGACIGAILNHIWLEMDANIAPYCDLLVMICMAAFFASVVRAPITAIVMVCEFSGNFAPLLPVIIGVSLGYIIGELCKTDGIYEDLLEAYEEEVGIHQRAERVVYTFTVSNGAIAKKREVREVLWPGNARVTEIIRGEEHILPRGETILYADDVLTIVCKTEEPEKIREELEHILH